MRTLEPEHVTECSAYLVDDYPYGFKLRCKIRYWLEFNEKRGFRFCSQTTNPKKGDIWNKPKRSTYCKIAAVMYLDENEHVQWAGLSEYSDVNESIAFRDKYATGLSKYGLKRLDDWIEAKEKFQNMLDSGEAYFTINGERV